MRMRPILSSEHSRSFRAEGIGGRWHLGVNLTLTVAENVLYSTLKLNRYKAGNAVGSGTGFFFAVRDGEKVAIMIITNKHVINGADQLVVACHTAKDTTGAEPGDTPANIGMKLNSAGIFEHPDPDIDMCGILFNGLMEQAAAQGHHLFIKGFEEENIPTAAQWQELDAIENVLMIGCPRGIYDEVNNMPLVREGMTATSVKKDYNGKPEFMVDMACFPGSSGSPVIMLNQGGWASQGNMVIGGTRLFLLGVLYAGPLISTQGVVLGQQPQVAVDAMMHLGQVIKSSELHKIADQVRTVMNGGAKQPISWHS